MDDLLQFVPEDQREQFSEVAKGYVKADPDVLLDFVSKNESLVDKIASKPLKTREQNLREVEFPKLLEQEREKIMKELNPEETPEQKRLRELEQKLADKERKEQEYERRKNLRDQYKDTAPDIAEKLYSLDDESVEGVVNYIAELKQKIDELEKNGRFGNNGPPRGGGKPSGGLEKMTFDQLMAYAKQGEAEKAEVLAFQKQKQ